MPQDELWACSARLTGYRTDLQLGQMGGRETTLFTFTPTWSKRPTGRNGSCAVEIETHELWEAKRLFSVAFDQWLGGDAKHVPLAVRHELSEIRASFQEGALG